MGALGRYGFRDAIDYTRPDPGSDHHVVGAYMAHHIGMSLVALTNVLTSQVWQRRFHADPLVRSAELLLHERIPRRLVPQKPQGAAARRGAAGRRRLERPVGARARDARHARAPRRAAGPPALHHHGEPLRRRATAATRSWR